MPWAASRGRCALVAPAETCFAAARNMFQKETAEPNQAGSASAVAARYVLLRIAQGVGLTVTSSMYTVLGTDGLLASLPRSISNFTF